MILQPFTTEPTFEDRMEAVYEAGREARGSGRPFSACPHQGGTPAAAEWREGWRDAAIQLPRSSVSSLSAEV